MVQQFNETNRPEVLPEYATLLKAGIRVTSLAKYLGLSQPKMSQYGRGYVKCPEEVREKLAKLVNEMQSIAGQHHPS